MNGWIRNLRRFVVSEDGPTAAEYAVLLSLIIVAAAMSIQAFGIGLSDVLQRVNGALFG